MKFRLINKIIADTNGYFWLPCPVCGKKFGGHEWGDSEYSGIQHIEDESMSSGICSDCEKEWQKTGQLSGIESLSPEKGKK